MAPTASTATGNNHSSGELFKNVYVFTSLVLNRLTGFFYGLSIMFDLLPTESIVTAINLTKTKTFTADAYKIIAESARI